MKKSSVQVFMQIIIGKIMPTSISDNAGCDGLVKSTYADNAILYSVINGKLSNGLSAWAVEADYLIIMAILKRHVRQDVILWAKNYYGVTSIYND